MDRFITERLWIRDIDSLRDMITELGELRKQGYALNIDPAELATDCPTILGGVSATVS